MSNGEWINIGLDDDNRREYMYFAQGNTSNRPDYAIRLDSRNKDKSHNISVGHSIAKGVVYHGALNNISESDLNNMMANPHNYFSMDKQACLAKIASDVVLRMVMGKDGVYQYAKPNIGQQFIDVAKAHPYATAVAGTALTGAGLAYWGSREPKIVDANGEKIAGLGSFVKNLKGRSADIARGQANASAYRTMADKALKAGQAPVSHVYDQLAMNSQRYAANVERDVRSARLTAAGATAVAGLGGLAYNSQSEEKTAGLASSAYNLAKGVATGVVSGKKAVNYVGAVAKQSVAPAVALGKGVKSGIIAPGAAARYAVKANPRATGFAAGVGTMGAVNAFKPENPPAVNKQASFAEKVAEFKEKYDYSTDHEDYINSFPEPDKKMYLTQPVVAGAVTGILGAGLGMLAGDTVPEMTRFAAKAGGIGAALGGGMGLMSAAIDNHRRKRDLVDPEATKIRRQAMWDQHLLPRYQKEENEYMKHVTKGMTGKKGDTYEDMLAHAPYMRTYSTLTPDQVIDFEHDVRTGFRNLSQDEREQESYLVYSGRPSRFANSVNRAPATTIITR